MDEFIHHETLERKWLGMDDASTNHTLTEKRKNRLSRKDATHSLDLDAVKMGGPHSNVSDATRFWTGTHIGREFICVPRRPRWT